MNNVAKMYEYFKVNGGNKLHGFNVHEIIGWEHQVAVYFKQEEMMIALFIKDYTVRVEASLNYMGNFPTYLIDTTVEYDSLEHLGGIISNVLDYNGMVQHSVADIGLDWEEQDEVEKVIGFVK